MVYCADDKPFKVYGKVWKVTKSEKYIDLQMTTSEKNADGEYVNSGWFPRVIGHAANSLKDVKEGDRIVITKAKFTNERYTDNDGNTKSRFRFLVFEATIESDNKTATTNQQTKTTADSKPVTEATTHDDECPW